MDADLKLKAEQLAGEIAAQAQTLDDLNGLFRCLMKSPLEGILDTESGRRRSFRTGTASLGAQAIRYRARSASPTSGRASASQQAATSSPVRPAAGQAGQLVRGFSPDPRGGLFSISARADVPPTHGAFLNYLVTLGSTTEIGTAWMRYARPARPGRYAANTGVSQVDRKGCR
jgi:hypothetical protein